MTPSRPDENRHSTKPRVALALAVLACGCSGPRDATPLPEPPSMVDLAKVGPGAGVMGEYGTDGGVGPASVSLFISGAPGAAPAGAELRVTNLDTVDPVTVASVRPDGSFDMELSGEFGQEFRFQVVSAGERGQPQDAVYVRVDQDEARFQPSPRLSCLELVPGFELPFPTNTASLSVESACSGAVTLGNLRLRSRLADFRMTSALPPSLAPGATASLVIELASNTPRPREDVLFMNVASDAQTLRYPVTLYAP